MAALTHQHPPSQEMSKANAEEAAATTTAATTAAATPTAAPSSGGAEEQSKGLDFACVFIARFDCHGHDKNTLF